MAWANAKDGAPLRWSKWTDWQVDCKTEQRDLIDENWSRRKVHVDPDSQPKRRLLSRWIWVYEHTHGWRASTRGNEFENPDKRSDCEGATLTRSLISDLIAASCMLIAPGKVSIFGPRVPRVWWDDDTKYTPNLQDSSAQAVSSLN